MEFRNYYSKNAVQSQYRGSPRDNNYNNSYNNFVEHLYGSPRRWVMNINDAIIKRIEEICKEKNINVCEAALGGGKSPSAIYDLIKGRTKCSKVSTIKAFCQGAGITLSEFFDKEYFNDFED